MNNSFLLMGSWRGPLNFRSELAQKGFRTPQTYIQLLGNFCKQHDCVCDLERLFADQSLKYLKEIVTKGNVEVVMNDCECMKIFNEIGARDLDSYYQKMRKEIEIQKHEDLINLKISSRGWHGSRNDVYQFLAEAAERVGFSNFDYRIIKKFDQSIAKLGFQKRLASGLVFYCGYDRGGQTIISSLPLHFGVYHENSPNDNIFLGDLRHILKGAEEYIVFGYLDSINGKITKIYQSFDSAVLGIHALLQLFDLFIFSIQNDAIIKEKGIAS